jgi:hypothetical protein
MKGFYRVLVEYVPDTTEDPDLFRTHWEECFPRDERNATPVQGLDEAAVWLKERADAHREKGGVR